MLCISTNIEIYEFGPGLALQAGRESRIEVSERLTRRIIQRHDDVHGCLWPVESIGVLASGSRAQ